MRKFNIKETAAILCIDEESIQKYCQKYFPYGLVQPEYRGDEPFFTEKDLKRLGACIDLLEDRCWPEAESLEGDMVKVRCCECDRFFSRGEYGTCDVTGETKKTDAWYGCWDFRSLARR